MADGSHTAIEVLQIGDQVWASDPETGEEGPRTVLATIVGEGVKTLVEITVDTTAQIDAGTLDQGDLPDGPSRPGPTVLGDAIIATDGHPFWAPLLGEWVDAVDLVPGMWFLSSEDTLVQVVGMRVWSEPERVYNLTVQDLHTYYVLAGDSPVLVHNCNPIASAVNELPKDRDRRTAGALDVGVEQFLISSGPGGQSQMLANLPGRTRQNYDYVETHAAAFLRVNPGIRRAVLYIDNRFRDVFGAEWLRGKDA